MNPETTVPFYKRPCPVVLYEPKRNPRAILAAADRRRKRFFARLERIRLRAEAADNLARTLRQEGNTEVAGYFTSLRNVYWKAHERALDKRAAE